MDFVEEWARFVCEHPGEWSKLQKELIDSQIKCAERFVRKFRHIQQKENQKRTQISNSKEIL